MTLLSNTGGLGPPPTHLGPEGAAATPRPTTQPFDDALVIARSASDPEAFALIFDRHFDTVHRYLGRRLGPHEADELAGEVFLRAFESRGRFSPDASSARPWLFGIATNLMRNRARSEERQFRALAQAANRLQHTSSSADDVDSRVDAEAAMGAVSAALATLASGERDAFFLLVWGELSYADIAAALDVPIGTVRSRLSRARSSLRSALPAHLEGSGHE